ncbi:MAG: FAD-binding oxidoreductase [Clostridium sp.]|nr:FAD-binding oxidoreductase [Clostridium sp.]MBP3215265.1 FAD-binding oxidoreductase [Clostridium sp.]
MNKTDVIIIGSGVIGGSLAWHLARKGKKVLVLEKKDTASGAAGATDGVVGYHTKKPGKQMDLAVQSIRMFDTLEEELGEPIAYGLRAGGMQPVEDKTQWDILSAIVEEQVKSGVDIRMISAEEARKIEPQLSEDIYGALYSPTGGKINPLKLTMAFTHAAKRLGAEYKYQTEVTGFIIENGVCLGVRTKDEEFYADAVVNCCGAWAGEVAALAGLDLPIKPRKGQLAVTEPIAPFMTATLQCARYNVIKFRPETIKDENVLKLGQSLSIEQQEEGGLIIGGTREFADFEGENTFVAIDAMMKRAARFFPALRNVSVIRFFSGFRPYTPDGMPLLGPVKTLDHFYMAAGHEGDGIALSPVTGKLMAEYIVDGKPSYDISDFSPNRFLA